MQKHEVQDMSSFLCRRVYCRWKFFFVSFKTS